MGHESRKACILVIEDNPADVALLRLALENAELDCDLTVLEDGGEALAFVREPGSATRASKVELVILDLNLPKNDGLEILEAMRASEAFSQIPVAILSSSSSTRERARMEKFSVNRFITKPADLEEFMKIGLSVKELLESTRNSGR
jgi:two-component system, chemotaxis family, response regulator Rcp1